MLEAEGAIGTGTSSRNSEVIHAGIYYPQGSLKARLCVARQASCCTRYCAERGVPHRRCGKLIVATDEAQVGAARRASRRKARANGVDDLRAARRATQARALEPALRLHGGAAFAEHRHRRQPRADAGAAGRRSRTPAAWWRCKSPRRGAAHAAPTAHRAAGRRRRHDAALRHAWSTPPACTRRALARAIRRACRARSCRAPTSPRATTSRWPAARRSAA